MLKKRVIFTLLYENGYFVLSRNFRLQKIGDLNWLKKNYNQSFVTINGKWENQENHLISLENPCLTIEEIVRAKSVIINKNYFHSKMNL